MKKIEVIVRHCHFSEASAHKDRLKNFSKERCLNNLLETSDKRVNLTFFLDTFFPMKRPHFLKKNAGLNIIEIQEGNEAGSFLRLLDYASNLTLQDDTIVYFLEDDYLHRPGWVDVLLEGFSLPADYVTLYDHKDKYFLPQYADLHSRLFHTSSCHWRTTPSTTNTFAMRLKTLRQDLDIHREFSLNKKISADHDKFCKLNAIGSVLISSIPGWSTHAEPDYVSPCVNWHELVT